MAIERTTNGLIEVNFEVLDTLMNDDDTAIADKVKGMSQLINNITKIGSLELANRKFQAQSPDLARKARSMALVHVPKEETPSA